MSDPHAPADGDATAIPSVPSTNGAGPAGPGGPMGASPWSRPERSKAARRLIRLAQVLAALLVLLVAAGWIAQRISVNYYVITPGEATPVSQYIEVPHQDAHPLTGTILLTDVFVTQLNALSYLQYKYLETNNEVISAPDLLGPTPSPGQYLDQGYLQMAQAQNFATAAALTHLGYKVASTNVGTLVYGIEPHSPASKVLKVGEVITSIDGTPTPTDCALIGALHGVAPGTVVTMSVEESSLNENGQFVGGPTVTKSATLGTPPAGLVDTGCGPPTKPTAFLGIDPQTQQDWHFPVDVTVHTQNIGGPSAGLSMTLGIIDELSTGRLTGNRIVAATGTIDQYGNVGDVGGVAEKTIAVERAGATVFFVPKVELATAKAKASPQLHVYAVSNVNQVLRILRRLGGSVPSSPAVPAQAQAAP